MTKPEFEALGLPLELATDGAPDGEVYDIVQPLEALVIVRGLDSSDSLCTWVIRTSGMDTVLALGCAQFAAHVCEKSL